MKLTIMLTKVPISPKSTDYVLLYTSHNCTGIISYEWINGEERERLPLINGREREIKGGVVIINAFWQLSNIGCSKSWLARSFLIILFYCTKKRKHSFDILYVKRMFPLFHAIVKFCSTNKLFTYYSFLC